jgi:two-component system sensor histidine kinase VanS
MKLTIRKRVFLLLSGFIVLLVLIGLICNLLLLRQFYVARNRVLLRTLGNEVVAALKQSSMDLDETLLQIDRDNNVGIRIVDASGSVLASSFTGKKKTAELPGEIQSLISEDNGRKLRLMYTKTVNENGNTNLVHIRRISGARYLVLSKSIKGIEDSAAIANRFYLIIGTGLILLGGGVTLLFSRVITKPIVEMSRVTARIAELDFSERVRVESKDELGVLGSSINEISEKLSLSIERLKRDIARRKRLVRDLSHELKTPIAVIKGYAEGLQFGVAQNAEQTARYCAVISAECDRMDAQIQQLLELSKLENEQMRPDLRMVSVHTIFDALSERFTREAAQKNVRLRFDASDTLQIFADEAMIGRAIENFLTNALRHTPDAGEIRVCAVAETNKTHLCVYNSGSSMTSEQLERIWDVFYTGGNGDRASGHGVGLAIVKSIAQLHGGSVSAENRENGVEFCLHLSRKDQP